MYKNLFHRSSFKWFWENTKRNCGVNQADLSSRWKKSFQKFSSVYFLGDSHTRSLYSYIAHSVGANVTGDRKNKWKGTSYRNVHFHFIKYNRDVPRIFDRFLDNFAQIKLKGTSNENSKGMTFSGKRGNNVSHRSDDSSDKPDDHNDGDDDDIKDKSRDRQHQWAPIFSDPVFNSHKLKLILTLEKSNLLSTNLFIKTKGLMMWFEYQ